MRSHLSPGMDWIVENVEIERYVTVEWPLGFFDCVFSTEVVYLQEKSAENFVSLRNYNNSTEEKNRALNRELIVCRI